MRLLRILVAALAVLSLAGPAMAASGPDRLGLSWDGNTWVDELTGTMFDRSGSVDLWVPGDSDTEHFYVRDQSGEGARLEIDYALPANPLVNDTDFALSASVDGGRPVTLSPADDGVVLDGHALADGQHAEVTVTAVFRWSSPNHSQAEQFPLDFRVRLSGIPGPSADTSGGGEKSSGGGSGGPGGPGGSSGGGLLPNTGAPEVRWAVGLGLLALGGGLGIVALSRRRDRDAEAS